MSRYCLEPMPGESQKNFEAFLAYRNLGPKRSLRAARRVIAPNSDNIPGSWRALPKRFHWDDRAKAYDEIRDVVEAPLPEPEPEPEPQPEPEPVEQPVEATEPAPAPRAEIVDAGPPTGAGVAFANAINNYRPGIANQRDVDRARDRSRRFGLALYDMLGELVAVLKEKKATRTDKENGSVSLDAIVRAEKAAREAVAFGTNMPAEITAAMVAIGLQQKGTSDESDGVDRSRLAITVRDMSGGELERAQERIEGRLRAVKADEDEAA